MIIIIGISKKELLMTHMLGAPARAFILFYTLCVIIHANSPCALNRLSIAHLHKTIGPRLVRRC